MMPPPASKTGPPTNKGFKQLIHSDTRGAKAAFEKHVQDTAGDSDVLTRCKKLNEFLSSDFLKQGGGADRAQLTEILEILKAGPKRPSFLDKPPVTATASERKKEDPPATPKPSPAKQLSGREAGQLLDLLGEEGEPPCSSFASPCKVGEGAAKAFKPSFSPMEQDYDDDLIGLLNPDASPPPKPTLSRKSEEDARQKEEAARKKIKQQEGEVAAAAALKKEAERKKIEEEQRRKKEQQEREKAERMEWEAEAKRVKEEAAAKAAEEARRIQRERKQQELEEEERQRQQEAATRLAAVTLQAFSRRHLAKKAAKELRASAATLVIQSAFRALSSRQQLVRLRAAAELRRRWAARVISKAYVEYRRQWRLGPVRAPAPTLPPKALDSHSHLLAKPVRLRSNSDARTARDPSPSSDRAPSPAAGRDSPGGRVSPEESSGRRTVESARRRFGEVGESESRRRNADGARAVMAGSSHREFQEAMAVVKKSNEGGEVKVKSKPPRAQLAK